MKKLLSTVLVTAIMSFPIAIFNPHNAAALTDISDTIETSAAGVDSNHLIEFITPTGVAAGQTIVLTFDDTGDAFDLTSVAFGDVDVFQNVTCNLSGGLTLAGSPSGATWGVGVNTGTDVITITSGSGTIAAGQCVQILIGDNASGGTNEINNPANDGTYTIRVTAGNGADSGNALVAIIDQITAQVTIAETLTFTVAGVLDSACTDRGGTENSDDTTATSVIFGPSNAGATSPATFYDNCQLLSISTNAGDGFTVTTDESDQLTSGANQIADGDCDGACSDTAFATWATASNDGFGYCLENITLAHAAGVAADHCDDGTPAYKTFPDDSAAETPEIVMSHSAGVSNAQIHVGYRLTYTGTQAAGVYTNTIDYVATPTY